VTPPPSSPPRRRTDARQDPSPEQPLALGGINGDPAALAAERALAELRRGRAIVVRDGRHAALAAPLETMGEALLARLHALGGERVALALSASRALALGCADAAPHAIAFRVHAGTTLATLRAYAGAEGGTAKPPAATRVPASRLMDAAVAAAKRTPLLPAVLVIEPIDASQAGDIVAVDAGDMERLAREADVDLETVSRARVPIATAEDCEVVLFRERRGNADHLAIVIGTPDRAQPVLVRLHSSCLTGDLLGSLRCDCGSQLRGAIDAIVAAGGGVLLYLAQEGRGIGLANKLRAYAIQDRGFDTIDADEQLGFESDERRYGAAAAMLRALGVGRIELLTNNPAKVAALQAAGIDVTARRALPGVPTAHNRRYLATKRDRAGHMLPQDEQD
jgi:GTP cyclohydrolase II